MSFLMFSAVGLQPISNLIAGVVADIDLGMLFIGSE